MPNRKGGLALNFLQNNGFVWKTTWLSHYSCFSRGLNTIRGMIGRDDEPGCKIHRNVSVLGKKLAQGLLDLLGNELCKRQR
jgi:hypothetical protein